MIHFDFERGCFERVVSKERMISYFFQPDSLKITNSIERTVYIFEFDGLSVIVWENNDGNDYNIEIIKKDPLSGICKKQKIQKFSTVVKMIFKKSKGD